MQPPRDAFSLLSRLAGSPIDPCSSMPLHTAGHVDRLLLDDLGWNLLYLDPPQNDAAARPQGKYVWI